MLNNLPESAFEIPNSLYKDLLQPSTQQVGTAVGTVVGLLNIFTLPLRAINDVTKIKYEKFLEELKERTQQIPPENLITPEISTVGPALLDLSFSINEDDVRNMYMNLLLHSMDSRADQANLRAFVQIMKQLSPFEARLFHFLFENVNAYPAASIYISCKPSEQFSEQKFYTVKSDILLIEPSFENASEELINLALQNFLRLGLIERDTSWIPDPDRYTFITSSETYRDMYEKLHTKSETSEEFDTIDSMKFFLTLTSFGEAFLKTCIL